MLATLAAPHPDPGHAVDRTAPFLWYTLSVIPQSQARVCQRARELGIETYVPMSRTPPTVRKFGRLRVAEAEVRPLMLGYVFVSLPSLNAQFGIFDPRHGSEALRGSLGFISCEQGPESQRWPMAISEAVIEDMRLRERNGEFDLTGLSEDGRHFVAKWVRVGAWVQLVEGGPFAFFHGVIEGVLSSTLIVVGVHIFGRVTAMTVPLDWVRLARNADDALLISKKNRTMRRTSVSGETA
jgi:transcription antitermination factor NusG